MREYFAGRETYDLGRIEELIEKSEVKGIILGDLFCQKRMFQNGIADLILLMDRVLASKKEAVYQAPLYVTGRNLEEVTAILRLMDGYKKESCVIVQDFGTARMDAGSYKNIRLIWGQMGRVRERRYSDEFLQFLKERGFTGMETGDQELAGRLYSFGLVPFFDNALLQYQTLGRICYLEYETGRCEPELCRQGCYSLRAGGEEYEMTIDGYMLGKKYRMIPENILETVHKKYGAELIFRKK